MSHGERQPWASTAGAVAAPPPPKSGTGAATAARSPAPPETTALTISQWELLSRGVSSAQQADLLALARQQGLLYSYQLPTPTSSRPLPGTDEPRAWNLLGKMLGGQCGQLVPLRPTACEVFDASLDDVQRHAVAAALATPDVFLIQGFPGTGKSRVIAEIVTQAGKRGDRVLFVAAHPAALDRVLDQIAARDSVCPIRCVGPEEHVAQLPSAIRALTFEERAGAVRTQTLRTARETRQNAELQCARRRHEEPVWTQLENLAKSLSEASQQIALHETKLAAVEADVKREAEASGRLAGDIRTFQKSAETQSAALAKEVAAAGQKREQDHAALATLDLEITAIKPLADAKQRGQWWSPAWWKGTFKGDVVNKLKELQTKQTALQEAVGGADKRLLELADAGRHLTEKTAADIQARQQTEIQARQSKLSTQIQHHQTCIQRDEALWADLARQIDPETLRPQAHTTDAVCSAREQWNNHRQDDEARCAVAREWAEFLESSSDALATRLPGYANLIAATPAALAADPHFGEAASASQFDLLVLDEADQLAETEFLKIARRARHWVLVGCPQLSGDNRALTGTARAAASGRGHSFCHLWQLLHCDPGQLPYIWFHEGQRLGCRLRQLDADQRRRLEGEPLADAPDVELRILALPRLRPVLAEVLFPGTMAVAAAKDFLFREMQEITVQAASHGLRWEETADATTLHFGPTYAGAEVVALGNGVREHLAGPGLGRTCKLEFDRAAGWERFTVEEWLQQQLGLRDLGRTAWLDCSYRMTPVLANIVHDLVGTNGQCLDANGQENSEPVVEFLPVMGSGKNKAPDRNNGRGPRKAEQTTNGATANGALPATGSGLEIDLAALHPGDRVPPELRGLTPGKGFVNLQEARTVVHKLEELIQERIRSNGHEERPTIAVIALYPAQAELIRHFIALSPQLAPHAGTIAVGPPAAFRQREADVVVVSLTRSHGHRAVAYGEGPAAVIQALTRARQRLVLVGDAGNLLRRSQWRGVLDHLDETAANREAQLFNRLVRYLQGNGRHQRAFRLCEGSLA